MTAVATNDASLTRPDIFRWTLCSFTALLMHGLIVLALVQRNEETDMDAGSPVALIELAPIPVAPSLTETDLPPGPPAPDTEQRERIDASEKPRQDEPPIQEAVQSPDTSDPVPPPKPPEEQMKEAERQQPVEASTAAAPPAATEFAGKPAAPDAGRATRLPSAAALHWQRSLVAQLERSKRYPRDAAGQSGIARLAFRIDRLGHLIESRILQGSGSTILDAETLATVRRAEPFPPPPQDVADDQLWFVVPIRYAASLRR